MRFACCFLVLTTLFACGKKRDSDPAPPATAAPENQPSEEEKSVDMTAPDPEPVATPSVTGEVTKSVEDPAGTRDATPADQPPRMEDKVRAEPDPGVIKDTTPSTPPTGISTKGSFGGKGAGGSVGGTGGGTGGSVDKDETLRQPKQSPKKDTQATGYHDKEQDEPTQE
jgi:hypothetical protein